MEKIWLKHYPPGKKHEINPDAYPSLLAVFDEAIRKYGPQPAFANLGRTITFSELDQLTTHFANYLVHVAGLKRGDRIAIQMPNLLQYPIALFGAMKAGLVVVNTNPLYTPREMQHQFIDSGVLAVVILANFAHQLEHVKPHTQIKTVIVTEIGDALPQPKRFIVNSVVRYIKKMVPKYNLPGAVTWRHVMQKGATLPAARIEPQPGDIAFIQYTGGTTGVSKGAMLTHRNMVANMEQVTEWFHDVGIESGKDVIITALPLYHIFALTCNCLWMMKMGCLNVLITNPRDMKAFIKDLAKYPWSVITGVNTLYNGLLNQEAFRALDFSRVKMACAGGMALQKAVAERWKKVTNSDVLEGFGMTETSPVTHMNPAKNIRLGTVGQPAPSTECKLIDDDGNEVTTIGERGELCIRGPQVMKGYWNRPDETEKTIMPDGFLKTGDIAVVDEQGFFKIVDRKKDMILVSGFNVYPNEIEDVLALHPKIVEVAAVGVPDEKSGEAVKVFIVRRDDSLTADDVRAYCKENFTGYKLPKYIEFRTELPKSNVGKILRRPLREESMSQPLSAATIVLH